MDRQRLVYERLEAMRDLEREGQDVRTRLSRDTLENVAPLAEELGMEREQRELEELGVRYGYPEDYAEIKHLMQENEVMCESTFRAFTLPIRSMLDSIGLEYELLFRMKSIYSIWRQIHVKQVPFDEVYDLFATRIVYKPMTVAQLQTVRPVAVEDGALDVEKLTLWRIYNIITSLWRIHPDRIKDWVNHPKPSGYQALQLTVMGPDCNWFEIQIRSERMDYEAEHGVAAHWKYKRESKATK